MEGPRPERVAETVAAIRSDCALAPAAGVILGSGLGPVADRLALERPDGGDRGRAFSTAELPHWPRSTVSGHAGRLVLGWWNGVPVVALRGRSHRYEGYAPHQVTHGVRVMRALGARVLVLTNAAGGLHPRFGPGTLMTIRGHLNFQGTRGLLAPEELAGAGGTGRGRPTPVYSARLAGILQEAARAEGLRLEEGVLYGGLGPTYETAAEVRAARRWGADAGSMSTVMEAVVGAALGMEVIGVSCITNLGTGLSERPLTHEEVTEVADRVASGLERILARALPRAVGGASAPEGGGAP